MFVYKYVPMYVTCTGGWAHVDVVVTALSVADSAWLVLICSVNYCWHDARKPGLFPLDQSMV